MPGEPDENQQSCLAAMEELRQLRGELAASLPRLSRAEAELRVVTEELVHTRQQRDDSWDLLRSLRRSATHQLAARWRRMGGKRGTPRW
jgi:hypothetical protein